MTRPRARSLLAALLLLAVVAGGALPLAAQPPEPPPVDAAGREAIIGEVISSLEEVYVFPDVASEMAAHLRERLADGSYDELDLLPAFCDALTEDLRSISHDKHLGVRWAPEEPTENPQDDGARQVRFAERLRRDNYCFRELRELEGNVGYLQLDCFAPAELGGATAVAAMGFLASSDALIIDLRQNGGGSPSMIQLLSSYFFAEPTHLNSFYIRRTDETQQFWTQAHVEGERMTDVPIWVLTSGRTFSAAEEFTYNLKNLERATIVGETTGGGAHPVDGHRLDNYPVLVAVPFGRAVNPVTGTNWEGTGVAPDLERPADQALDVAHAEAVAVLAGAAEDPERKANLEFIAGTMKLRLAAADGQAGPSADELRAYVGTYGPRVITFEEGTLRYRRGDGPVLELEPVGYDLFLFAGETAFRLRFERAGDGRVVRIVGLYADGREEPHDRNE